MKVCDSVINSLSASFANDKQCSARLTSGGILARKPAYDSEAAAKARGEI